ncbi:hypothetical protein CR513_37352, partial [Mucuna pruriens]
MMKVMGATLVYLLGLKEVKGFRRRERHRDEPKRTPAELLKGDGIPNAYYDWEIKVEQNLEFFDCEGMGDEESFYLVLARIKKINA